MNEAVSQKYLQKMLSGYLDNIPKISKHIEEIKTALLEAEKQKLDMHNAIYDIRDVLGIEHDPMNNTIGDNITA